MLSAGRSGGSEAAAENGSTTSIAKGDHIHIEIQFAVEAYQRAFCMLGCHREFFLRQTILKGQEKPTKNTLSSCPRKSILKRTSRIRECRANNYRLLAGCMSSSAESSTILSFRVICLICIANPVLWCFIFAPSLTFETVFSSDFLRPWRRRCSDRGIARW
jgi:hypothetical protein